MDADGRTPPTRATLRAVRSWNVALPALVLTFQLLVGVALAWLARDTPLAPGRAAGLLRADALCAIALIGAAAQGLVALTLGAPAWRQALCAALVGLATVTGHLGVAGGFLLAAGVAAGMPRGWPGLRPIVTATLAAGGLVVVGLTGGEWLYSAPEAGLGLNSISTALLLGAVLLAAGADGLPRSYAPASEPILTVGALYALLRLFSLGPWNLGWLLAALLLGCAAALWAAWAAASAPSNEAAPWLGLHLVGLAVMGAGLASGAGVVLAGYVLLLWPLMRLGLTQAAPARALWLLSAALPLSGPFVGAWMGVAAALAGGSTLLAAAIWVAALLAALPAARLAVAATAGGAQAIHVAAALSAALGLGAPLVVATLLQPLASQLRGGLTPFGEIELWPWAGLIAFDAARQPVATLPSLALVALMLILAALGRITLRLMPRRDGGSA